MAEPKPAERKDIAVFWSRRDSHCDGCDADLGRGSTIWLDGDKAYCLACADMEHLWFLPSGDTALTRRSRKYSGLSAVVLQWSRSRRRYERQGVLVEPEALARAEEECLADADLRAARRERAAEQRERWDERFVESFTGAIRAGFPGCPKDEAGAIARRACERGSGRIGRTEAGRDLSAEAIELAVRAHVRHTHTPYDDYLMRGWDRYDARDRVRPLVDEVLERWAQ